MPDPQEADRRWRQLRRHGQEALLLRAALLARRAGGALFGHVGEAGAAFDLLLEGLAFGFRLDEDVAGAGSGHGFLSFMLLVLLYQSEKVEAQFELRNRSGGAVARRLEAGRRRKLLAARNE